MAPPPRPARVEQHLQPLGILWCLFGAMRLLTGAFAAFALHGMVHEGMFSEMPPVLVHALGMMAPFIALLTLVLSIGAVMTGYGLLTRKPWARSLAMVMSVLSLLKLPVGTALGIYTLWVMAPRSSWAEWEEGQRA